MRQILSVSMSKADAQKMKTTAKKRGYASVSAYIQSLYKNDEQTISENELLGMVREARKEYKTGKTVKAKSMKDLL